MAANSVVRARIDGQIKVEAEAVLASIGLTVSDAFDHSLHSRFPLTP
jgi:DNA-damage-inducible protein J